MEDSKGREGASQEDKDKEALGQRKSEATSDETLSELEQTENVTGPGSSKRDPGPSPDGLLDEPDEIKDAGPM
jgi:hypothetical protein